jgi:hypothetical protein
LVIELLETDNREIARNETQREMQMAIDYISTDIREAVYVYDGVCLQGGNYQVGGQQIPNQCSNLFANNQIINHDRLAPNGVPILAFWKLETLPDDLKDACADDPQTEVEDQVVPCLSGRTYSLIIYYLSRNDPQNEPWQGKARILRYELSKYTNNGNLVNGYTDPTQETTFSNWPIGTANQSPGISDPTPVTLVDFVDDRAMANIPELTADGGNPNVQCPNQYTLTPADGTLQNFGFAGMRNFYACVRIPEQALSVQGQNQANVNSFNQKVILFLRGNALGKAGVDSYNEGFLPAIATQVLNRGVRNKTPSQ